LADSIPISEGIDKLLGAYNLENKYLQTLIITKWENVMGAPIASRTEKIYFKDRTMFVVMSSPSLRHQLTNSASKIVKLINDSLEKEVIDKVVVL
jgi:hypothetical protein